MHGSRGAECEIHPSAIIVVRVSHPRVIVPIDWPEVIVGQRVWLGGGAGGWGGGYGNGWGFGFWRPGRGLRMGRSEGLVHIQKKVSTTRRINTKKGLPANSHSVGDPFS